MTNKYSLLASLLFRPWAINFDYAQASGKFVASLLNPNLEIKEAEEPLTHKPFAVNYFQDSLKYPDGYDNAPSGSVAVIPVRGELMKYDQFCGPAGMHTIGKRIQEADAHRNISSIMMVFDTPGGTVDGTKALGNIIKNIEKPNTGLVDGMAASAGIWLASNCKKIIATTEIDQLGSIGVMNSFVDMQPYWEQLGIKFHEVYSDLSKDKNRLFAEMRQGNYANYKKDVLNPLAEEFRNVIRNNRPNVKEEHLTGKMFFAKDLVGTLVDEIASFDEAIAITADMGKSLKPRNSQTYIKSKNMDELKILASAAGVEAFEIQDDGIFLTEDQAKAVAKVLADNKAKMESLALANEKATSSLCEANNNLATVNGKVNALEIEKKTLETTIKVLGGQPAEESAEVVTSTNSVKKEKEEDPCVVNEKESFVENLHNVAESYL